MHVCFQDRRDIGRPRSRYEDLMMGNGCPKGKRVYVYLKVARREEGESVNNYRRI
jgi:hypothetical protein